jgi:hypothetical protein
MIVWDIYPHNWHSWLEKGTTEYLFTAEFNYIINQIFILSFELCVLFKKEKQDEYIPVAAIVWKYMNISNRLEVLEWQQTINLPDWWQPKSYQDLNPLNSG